MDLTTALLLLLTTLLPLAAGHSPLFARDYVDTVCKPATKNPTDTVPPCVEIETIETLCVPNGTEPIYLIAHQECMCGGSYFSEWPACQNCLFYHGLRTERDVAQYDGILSAASSAFCGAATPSTTFAAVFSSIQSSFPVPTTGGTVSSDRGPSQTAVSLYYTASGSQGPGAITGSAATATATRLITAPVSSGTTGGSGSGSGSGAGTGSQTSGGGADPGTTPTTGPSGSASPSATTKPNGGARMWDSPSGMFVLFVMVVAVTLTL
ncbi:hypothetical protein CONLIGDRAFT_571340 [Coniochaeta ligniaria NRRL 30616]|uniref:Collagen-like protein Mcl1 n=1 Tax=Coniochaeta ligniaria NRRL 30616 TaxID=1408157 RepID=A0A1J7JNV6_9PEZI|nr:hypothetical protein CONLIGDRAFT_571340 [Coniochaeta ligniaria NRRL 30616]